MDLFKKYFNDTTFFSFVSDYVKNYFNFVNEKPLSSVLAPITLTLLCYYIYIYIRKFYPIYVNCWFCNINFKVAFEDRFEYICIECGQFNGFKEDGSYSKIIPEQHDQRYNRTVFAAAQNDTKESKNGLCHKCNIIQEMKVKQLASFIPTKEKYFDKEVEKFKEQLEKTLKLCSKCNLFSKKILSLQEQRYNLKSILVNNQMDVQNIYEWPDVCSLCYSLIVFLLSFGAEKYLSDWVAKFMDPSISISSAVTVTRSVGFISLNGIICQTYQCLSTMNKLNAVIMLLWSSLFTINNFEILLNFQPKLFVSVLIVLLSSVSILKKLTKKKQIRQTSIQLENDKHQYQSSNYCDISTNGSVKNSDESEMMDYEESPIRVKKPLKKTVNNMFQGMKINENRDAKYNVLLRPAKLSVPVKRDKFAGYAESSPGYYTPYSMKDDYEFDTQSIYSQHSYRSQCPSLYHQTVTPYNYYLPPYHHPNQPSPLNMSHSSNTSNIQYTSEWPKMLMYSIPGIILLALQCYLLYDIKDFMKQK